MKTKIMFEIITYKNPIIEFDDPLNDSSLKKRVLIRPGSNQISRKHFTEKQKRSIKMLLALNSFFIIHI